MVFFSNTVIDPLTVMIKHVYTTIAYVAMSGISGKNRFTCRTKAVCIVFFNQFVKSQILIWCLNISWIFEGCEQKKYVYYQEMNVQLKNIFLKILIREYKKMKLNKCYYHQNDILKKSPVVSFKFF